MRLRALPSRQDNYIWTLSDDDGRAIIVDPGESGPVLDAAENGLRPAVVLLTHHHYDHVDGTGALLERWPGLPVYAPRDPRIHLASHRVGEGDRFEALGAAASVIEVPGHTSSHVAFHLTRDGDHWLFCGDTLFSLGCGRLFEGSPTQMHRSLQRLAALPADTRVCCGHEYTLSNAAFARAVEPDNPALMRRIEEAEAMRQSGRPSLPSTLASELACNPFLRCERPDVVAAVTQRLGHSPDDAVETFAELRRWKDGFVA